VAEDQALADVMTDKATVEIPSSAAGKVLALGGAVGQILAVGAELIRIEVEGVGNERAAKAPPAAPPATAIAPASRAAPATTMPAEPLKTAPIPTAMASARPLASPALRKRAAEAGVDLQALAGSGPEGRIMQEDLDAVLSGKTSPGSTHTLPVADTRYARRDDQEAIPVIGLRRKIAQKMQESKQHIPHFTYVEEVDVSELEALRARLNAQWGAARGKLTLLPFIMRSLVMAVRDYPQINARYDDTAGAVTRFGGVHLGIATQTEAGLMVPVVRHAETRDLWAAAAEVTRLAAAARSGKATRDELGGSTITITSLGALGGIASTPVINYPEVAIVGINRIVERPMFQGAAVVPRKLMNLSSAFDHRVVDGLHAAEFVQKMRGYLEYPATLFID
jgi:2-oxoisovalerate dehydrogenase E2 component (dihydrolipoyl transacylase)